MKKLFVFFIAISMMALFFGCKNESADDVQPVNVPMEQKIQSDRITDVIYERGFLSVFPLESCSLEEFLSEFPTCLFDLNPDDFEDNSHFGGVRILVCETEFLLENYGENQSVGKFLARQSDSYSELGGWTDYGECRISAGGEACLAEKLQQLVSDLYRQLEDGMYMELALEVERDLSTVSVYGRVKESFEFVISKTRKPFIVNFKLSLP